jgi:hypothetical protein
MTVERSIKTRVQPAAKRANQPSVHVKVAVSIVKKPFADVDST